MSEENVTKTKRQSKPKGSVVEARVAQQEASIGIWADQMKALGHTTKLGTKVVTFDGHPIEVHVGVARRALKKVVSYVETATTEATNG